MGRGIIHIVFEVDAHRHEPGHFTVPRKVTDALDLHNNNDIALIIESGTGTHSGIFTLKSGTEIYGKDLRELILPGEHIRVTAACPD